MTLHIARWPGPYSELSDVVFSYENHDQLNTYIAGCGHARYASEEHKVHETRGDALEDIMLRCTIAIQRLERIREEAEVELSKVETP